MDDELFDNAMKAMKEAQNARSVDVSDGYVREGLAWLQLAEYARKWNVYGAE